MKISLCELLVCTQSVRVTRNTLNIIIVHNVFVQCLQIIIMISGVHSFLHSDSWMFIIV